MMKNRNRTVKTYYLRVLYDRYIDKRFQKGIKTNNYRSESHRKKSKEI